MFAQDSIDLLTSSGIDFQRMAEHGIDIHRFGELLTMSGLVLNDDVKWLSFHSGYDFGYLLKTLTCQELPPEEAAFMDLLYTFFPCIFDMKYMMTAVEGMYGGLNNLADMLQVERLGPIHQAGSDSMLTASAFFGFIERYYGGHIDESKFRGELFGLGNNHTKFKSKYPLGGGGGGTIHYPLQSNQSGLHRSTSYGNAGSLNPPMTDDHGNDSY